MKNAHLIIILILITGLLLLCKKDKTNQNNYTSGNPLYKNYQFGEKNTLFFGTQPLLVPTSALIEFMKRDRYFNNNIKRLGFKIKWYPFLKGKDVNSFISEGKLHGGIGGDMPAITLASKIDIEIVTIFQYGNCSIISKDIRSINNLSGKKIAYAPGSNAFFLLMNTLDLAGININEVKLIPMNVNVMAEKLISGDIDAFSAWEPTPTIALKKNPNLVKTAQGITYGFMYFKTEFFNKNPEIVYHIIASQLRAITWLSTDSKNLKSASRWSIDNAENFLKRKFEITIDEYSRLIKNDIITTHPDPSIRAEILSISSKLYKEFQLLRKTGYIPEMIIWDTVEKKFNTEIVTYIKKNKKKYRPFQIKGIPAGDSL